MTRGLCGCLWQRVEEMGVVNVTEVPAEIRYRSLENKEGIWESVCGMRLIERS
ncbi:hypothetical protein Hanom_Chr06g00550571 [Helianthus anomalus]